LAGNWVGAVQQLVSRTAGHWGYRDDEKERKAPKKEK